MLYINPNDYNYEKLEILGKQFEEEIKSINEINKEEF